MRLYFGVGLHMGMGMVHDGCGQQENSLDVDRVMGEGFEIADCIEVESSGLTWW